MKLNRYDALAALLGIIGLMLLGAWVITEDWRLFVATYAVMVAMQLVGRKGNL